MIQFDSVTFVYGAQPTGRRAVDRVTFTLAPGEMLAVLGANGSGKSTLARLANGLLSPTSGRVTVDGVDTLDVQRVRDVRTAVGVVFQRPDDQIVATSVEDDVAFGPENLGLPRHEIRRRVDEALAAVGLAGLERREPHLLSGGQKQRLALAGVLALSPRYLVLDEPTSMLDPQGRDELMRVVGELRSAGHGIICITHDIAEALQADRILVMKEGRVIHEGVPDVLLSGVDLADAGLELPPIAVLGRELRGLGLQVGGMSEAEIVEAVCR